MIRTGRPGAAPLGVDIDAKANADLTARLAGELGLFGVPDPVRSVQESVGAIPVVPPMPEVPKRPAEFMTSEMQPSTTEEVAAFANVPYNPAAQQEPVYRNGEMVLDADGNPVMRTLSAEDYQQQLATERRGFASVAGAVSEMSQNPEGAQGAVRTLMEAQRDAAANANARVQERIEKGFKGFDRFIDSVGAPLGVAVNNAIAALFDPSKTKAATSIDEMGRAVAPGIHVLGKMGQVDGETARLVATLGGLAFNQAVAQMGVARKKDKTTGEDGGNEAPEGSEFMSNAINSVGHFLKNGIRNTGVNMDSADAEYLAKALITDAWRRGDLLVGVDPHTGNKILTASPAVKQTAMALQRVSEAVTGATTRKASSTSPTATGVTFAARGPKMTAKSLEAPGIVTAAANATKNILGSVAMVFRKKDFDRKVKELSLVFHPDFVVEDPNTGEFMYSTHPFAKRNGVHEGAYKKALVEVDTTEKFVNGRPGPIREQEARNIMMTKRKDIEFTMQSISDKSGLRYAEFIHSLANQRFFVNSYDLDYMGSKNIIRDVMGLAYQDSVRANHLFDPAELARLQSQVRMSAFGGTGQQVHDKLTKLHPQELAALGTIHNAVVFYYTAIEPDRVKNIHKYPVADAIKMYTPAMGERLAAIGEKYNAFLQNPSVEPDQELAGLWAATEKGEALGTLNLVDDFFKAKALFDNPATTKASLPITHHVFDDGNQNGIFLQSLFFGLENRSSKSDALTRLSMANPNLNDMRRYFMDTVVDNLDQYMKDNKDQTEKAQAWGLFWKEAAQRHPDGVDGVARDFGKIPLMQNSYGKDASMFTDVMYQILEADKLYSELAGKHLLTQYETISAAATDLSKGVELTLRQVIDSRASQTMKSIGRAFALYNTPMMLEGITGDTYVISSVGVAAVPNQSSNKNLYRKKIGEQEVVFKTPSYITHSFVDPTTGEETQVPSYSMQFLPAHAKGRMKEGVGVQTFYNRTTDQYDDFHNPLGMSLARQAVVLTIQSLDGDLVKWATIETNKDLKVPRPVIWVHDSIISTPGSALIYRNMYNNVAIPRAIPEIKKFGMKIKNAMKDAKNKAVKLVEERGEPVGIGAEGDFPVLGAVFDEFYMKIMDENYKERRIASWEAMANKNKRKINTSKPSIFKANEGITEKSPAQKWDEMVVRINKILNEAEKLGWVEPDKLPYMERRHVAVPAKNFKPLMELAERLIGVSGPDSLVEGWLNDFATRVDNAKDVLTNATRKGGIWQMSPGGGKRPAPVEKGILPKAKLVEASPNEKLVPPPLKEPPKMLGGYPASENFNSGFDDPVPF